MTAFFRGPTFQSVTWHQISWSEADAAPFPGWSVPGAVSRSHGFYRRTHSCGKSQQRYMDTDTVWFHNTSITKQNYPSQPVLCIPFIVIYHTILLWAHMKPFSFIITYLLLCLLQFQQRHFRRTWIRWASRSKAWKRVWKSSLPHKVTRTCLWKKCPYPFILPHFFYYNIHAKI